MFRCTLAKPFFGTLEFLKTVTFMQSSFYFHIAIIIILFICIGACKAVPQVGSKKTSTQIDTLLSEKNSRTPAQRKIDSQLLQAIKEYQGGKMAEGVNLEPANVHADSKGNFKADISANVTDSLINKIKALGGTIIFPSQQYHTIRAQINLLIVEKIAALRDVNFIAPAAIPQLHTPVRPGSDRMIPGIDIPVNSPPNSDSRRVKKP